MCLIDVLEHVKDDRRVIKNVYNALKGAGILYLHVPLKKQRIHFKKFVAWKHRGHVRDGYSEKEIECIIEESGFKVKEMKRTFGRFASLAWELNQISLSNLSFAAIIFPFLMIVALRDAIVNYGKGNCIFIIAEKQRSLAK